MNAGWSWATAVMLALGLGCLLLVGIFGVVLGGLLLSVAWTLTRSR